MLTDNSTKLEVFMPELSPETDAELFKLAKRKEAAVIIMDPAFFESVLEVIQQAKDLIPGAPVEWEQDPETDFLSPAQEETK